MMMSKKNQQSSTNNKSDNSRSQQKSDSLAKKPEVTVDLDDNPPHYHRNRHSHHHHHHSGSYQNNSRHRSAGHLQVLDQQQHVKFRSRSVRSTDDQQDNQHLQRNHQHNSSLQHHQHQHHHHQQKQTDGNLLLSQKQVLTRVKTDRQVATEPDEDRRRRTIIVSRHNGNFGFSLQTYGIKHKKEGEVELITYVDQVDVAGPAYRGGMRPGDVFMSINGKDVEKMDHKRLVELIQSCPNTMRVVVLFEDCVRKVELHIKYLKLRKSLQQKMLEYQMLCQREQQILSGSCRKSSTSSQPDNHTIDNQKPNPTTTLNNRKSTWKSLDSSLADDDVVNCNDIKLEPIDDRLKEQRRSLTANLNQNQDVQVSTSTMPTRKGSSRKSQSRSLPRPATSSAIGINEMAATDDRDIVTKL